MPFPFTCPECRHTSQVFDHLAGVQAKCPSCGCIVKIPAPNAPTAVVYLVEEPTAHATPTPTSTKRKTRSSLLPILIAVGGLLVFFCCAGGGIGAFFLVRYADQEDSQLAEATSQPRFGSTRESSKPAPNSEPPIPPDEDSKPPAYWVQLLKESNPARVKHARTKLVQFGALAVPELRKIIHDPDPDIRLAVLGIVAQIGDLAFDAVGDVTALLNDREAAVRVAAARTLGQLGKPARASLPALIAARSDPHPQVREAVTESLRRFSPLIKDDVSKVTPLLKDGTPEQRSANISALRELKPDAETTFALFNALLADPNKKIRLEALMAVAEGGKTDRSQALARLVPMLNDPDSDVRATAITVVSGFGPSVAADLPMLQAALRGKEVESRRFAAEALGGLGAEAAPAVPFLARALSDTDLGVRSAAIASLGKVGKPALEVLDDILGARSDADPVVRKGVLRLLRLAGRRPGVFEALLEALNDNDETVRAAAIEGLRSLKPPPGKDEILIFQNALKSDKVDVRRYAAAELERLGRDAELLIGSLLNAVKDPDSEVRKFVFSALGAIGPKAKQAAPALLAELEEIMKGGSADAGAGERFRRAATTLCQIGETEQTVPLLRKALKSRDARLRQEVIAALGMIGPNAKEMIPELCALLGDAENQAPAAAALAQLGRVAVPELIKVLEKSPRNAKMGAIKALELMKPEEARESVSALYSVARIYKSNEVGAAAKAALAKINPSKKN